VVLPVLGTQLVEVRTITDDPKYTVVPQRERLAARHDSHAATVTR
jgi:hypothetical protein